MAKKPQKVRVRDQWQLALYVPADLVKPLRAEARRMHRGFGPTVLEIMRRYFATETATVIPEVETDVTLPPT